MQSFFPGTLTLSSRRNPNSMIPKPQLDLTGLKKILFDACETAIKSNFLVSKAEDLKYDLLNLKFNHTKEDEKVIIYKHAETIIDIVIKPFISAQANKIPNNTYVFFTAIGNYLDAVRGKYLNKEGLDRAVKIFLSLLTIPLHEVDKAVLATIQYGLGTSTDLRYELIKAYNVRFSDNRNLAYFVFLHVQEYINNPSVRGYFSGSGVQRAKSLLRCYVGKDDSHAKERLEFDITCGLSTSKVLRNKLLELYQAQFGTEPIKFNFIAHVRSRLEDYIFTTRSGTLAHTQSMKLKANFEALESKYAHLMLDLTQAENLKHAFREELMLFLAGIIDREDILNELQVAIGYPVLMYLGISEQMLKDSISTLDGPAIPCHIAMRMLINNVLAKQSNNLDIANATELFPTQHHLQPDHNPVLVEASAHSATISTSSLSLTPPILKLEGINTSTLDNDVEQAIKYQNPFN